MPAPYTCSAVVMIRVTTKVMRKDTSTQRARQRGDAGVDTAGIYPTARPWRALIASADQS